MKIKDIKFPELGSVDFGAGVQNVCNTINNNFAILANHDFIKGEPGDSINIAEINLDEKNPTPIEEFWQRYFKITILRQNMEIPSNITNEELAIIINKSYINGHQIFGKNLGKLYLISSTNVNDLDTADTGTFNNTIISSLYYVFYDDRFANIDASKNQSAYNDAYDYSCILQYDNNTKTLHPIKSFPTLYYDDINGFCWRINNKKTGISAQGLAGKDGLTGYTYLVKIKYTNKDNNIITEVFDQNKFIKISEVSNDVKESLKEAAVFAIPDIPGDSSSWTEEQKKQAGWFWISRVFYNSSENLYYVYVNDINAINLVISKESFYDMLKLLDKGIFIPGTATDGLLSGHYIYHDSNALRFRPVKDVDSSLQDEANKNSNNIILDYNGVKSTADFSIALGNNCFASSTSTAIGNNIESNTPNSFGHGSYNYNDDEFIETCGVGTGESKIVYFGKCHNCGKTTISDIPFKECSYCGTQIETIRQTEIKPRVNAYAITKDGRIYVKGIGGYKGQEIGRAEDLATVINRLANKIN